MPIAIKKCKHCDKDYQPVGNRQFYCKECVTEVKRIRHRLYCRDYRKRNLDKVRKYCLEKAKIYYKRNSEKFRKIAKERNKKKYFIEYKTKYNREYGRKRRKTDYKFKLNSNISSYISQCLKDRKKERGWEYLVGYTLKDLIKHIEKQFNNDMSWDNYGSYWHIDHIKPKSLFKVDEIKECWALENLQPLEASENIKKSNHYEEH